MIIEIETINVLCICVSTIINTILRDKEENNNIHR